MGSNHLTWHETTITKKDRQRKNQHKSVVLWFTGLSGSGKSTLANAVDNELFKQHYQSYCLDGDNIRHGLNRDLTFRNEDRKENIRRIGEVAKLFVDSGQIVSTAFISPFREDRQLVRNMFEKDEFIEIYVKCPINICEKRDPKGLYKKARLGEISDFTGISSPYERPNNPEVVIQTDRLSIDESVSIILSYLKDKTILY
ncbi:adenylyl-sulfate kinase [Heyndrickxia oleronia]|uniref:Adenylyl-sulfate kinase n=1 Tax=Heyndrickxia oleronia TaxID=38875 RepID=A0AAW6SLL8_9BACI|nr:adenylyl-sulfate kinase [Heyndrickxia oleronia]MDH5159641.1 adenylyl-sulfate kinase [Heyndrickxia oleronia]